MKFEIYNDESKVHLVLSNECNYCLENDANSFGITKGSLVNKIICNYYNDANASKEYKIFKSSGDNISWFFKLNNASKEVLMYDCRKQAELYGNKCENQESITPTKYIRALLEEYSLLSYSNREKIIFKENHNKIMDIINRNCKILIKLTDNTYIVRPYKLLVDKSYNYLVGFSKCCNSNEEEKVVSFRLSRISKIKNINEKFSFSKEDIKEIHQSIKDKGVAYLLGDIEEITVNFTQNGKKMYNIILQDRPKKIKEITNFNSKTDDLVVQYKFKCTILQATNYFRRFGSDVEIVEPLELRNSFKEDFKKALNRYDID